MTLNDAVSDNILNFDGAEFRISIVKNGNMVEDYTGHPGFYLVADDVWAIMMVNSGITSGIHDLNCLKNLRNILVGIVDACESCDLDFLAENLDKFVATDIDGTIYQFYVDIFNVDISF